MQRRGCRGVPTTLRRFSLGVALAARDFACSLGTPPNIRYAQLVYEEEEQAPFFEGEEPSLRLTYRLEFYEEEGPCHIVEFAYAVPKK